MQSANMKQVGEGTAPVPGTSGSVLVGISPIPTRVQYHRPLRLESAFF
jgi:hypothetical protein